MRLLRLGLIAIPLVLAAACGSSNEPGAVKSPHVSPSTSAAPATQAAAPSAANNKVQAKAEAAKLVAQAVLPPGAVETKTQPAQLTGPITGRPGLSQLVDTVRYYRLPMSISQAHDWIIKHPQPGFTQNISESGTSAGVSTFGWQYDVPAHFSWGTGSLQIGLAAESPTSTGVRVDGLAEWIDPTPVRDTLPGNAIRVTVPGGCPPSDSGISHVSNPDAPDLDHALLPAIPPSAALVCSYDGLNGKPFTLVGNQKLSASQASVAAEHIRSLPLGSQGLGPHSCPMDDARAAIVVFSYAGRADVDIWESTSGCRSTSNGHIVAGFF